MSDIRPLGTSGSRNGVYESIPVNTSSLVIRYSRKRVKKLWVSNGSAGVNGYNVFVECTMLLSAPLNTGVFSHTDGMGTQLYSNSGAIKIISETESTFTIQFNPLIIVGGVYYEI